MSARVGRIEFAPAAPRGDTGGMVDERLVDHYRRVCRRNLRAKAKCCRLCPFLHFVEIAREKYNATRARKGYIPLCPHAHGHEMSAYARAGGVRLPESVYIAQGMAMLRQCEIVVLTATGAKLKRSKGSQRELKAARERGMQVYDDIDAVPHV